MKHPILKCLTTAICGFAILVVTSAPARAQDTAQVVYSARTTGRLNLFVWSDDALGTRYDAQASQQLAQTLANSEWRLMSNGQLQISADNQVLISEPYLPNRDQSVLQLFFVHRWSARGYANGLISRRPDALSEGQGELFITTVAEDGKSVRTVWIIANLEFQPGQDGNAGGTGGGFGGYGF